MIRHYYAVLDDTVYVFERRRIRERFCIEKKAKRIFSYERHRYRVHVDMSKIAKKRANSHEKIIDDISTVQSQNAVNRAVTKRQKEFKGQR